MLSLIRRYTHWLHTQWPAGRVEKLPVVGPNGETNLPGVYVVGDLAGVPLLKFSLQTGVRAVRTIRDDPRFRKLQEKKEEGVVDIAILGAGLAGYAAAIEAKKHGLSFALIEANRPLSTIVNFPRGKPIYAYPNEMTPEGDLQVSADVKESLVAELESQIEAHGIETQPGFAEKIGRVGGLPQVDLEGQDPLRARRVIVAIGRSGNHRKLDVRGEELDKVVNRLHDPNDFSGSDCLVVGGGDSALEAAIALAQAGAVTTLSYRKKTFSRPKPENIEGVQRLVEEGSIDLALGSKVQRIEEGRVLIEEADGERTKRIPNDFVFSLIGREAPLDFFRRSGIRLQGEWSPAARVRMGLFLAFCVWLYLWKGGGNPISNFWTAHSWFPFNLTESLSNWIATPETLLGTLALSMTEPAFYYGLVYSVLVAGFGWRRIRRRNTPYITKQTLVLTLIQVVPLFLLPFILLPWMGHNGLLPVWFADTFFPEVDYGHGRAYWRSLGFILAWPLFVHNVFTPEPLWGWLAVSLVQTFAVIPLMIYYWGKGAYCGWICSCGALAETLGDAHRAKMPHGSKWNRLNMAGQVILLFAFFLFFLRVLGWMGVPGIEGVFHALNGTVYKYVVDTALSAIVGVGFYFWYSGRTWCRFFCPLAALMHIYARFSRFRIFSEKKKCISCNVCTSVCHQGIDIMDFANKGIPMSDPECVRCSACVHDCPTGVLSFGQVATSGEILCVDKSAASPVRIAEGV